MAKKRKKEAKAYAEQAVRNRPVDAASTLAAPFEGRLLGMEVSADLYARNGFRFLATPACADKKTFEGSSQRLRGYLAMGRPLGKCCIQLGHDDSVPIDDVRACVTHLRDPKRRILAELFWPHLSAELFSPIKDSLQIASPEVIRSLEEFVAGNNGHEGLLATHALAVSYHIRAINGEVRYMSSRGEANDENWIKAIEYWGKVIGADAFWQYLRQRAVAFDDPRLNADDVGRLQRELPAVLLGFNATFARAFAQSGDHTRCRRHLALIGKSGFATDNMKEMLVDTVRTIVKARLDPLIQQAQNGKSETNSNGRIPRKNFVRYYEPIIDEALRVRDYLKDELRLGDNLIALAQFDRLCEIIHDIADKKMEYSGDDRERTLQYSMIVTKRLLDLPVSSGLRSKLVQSNRTTIGYLYTDLKMPRGFDPTECWFLPGEPADPDCSIYMPVYKITKVEGNGVRFNIRTILVPRSRLAYDCHRGKADISALAARNKDAEGRQLLAEIERIKAEAEEEALQVKKERDQKINVEKQKVGEQLAAFQDQVKAREQEDKQELARAEAEFNEKAKAEKKETQKEIAEAKQRKAAPLAEAPAVYKRVSEANKGLRGAGRLELPLSTVSAGLCAAGGYFGTLAGNVATTLTPTGVAGYAAAVGLGLGAMVGQMVRQRRIRKAANLVDTINAELDREVEVLRADCQARVDKHKAEAFRRTTKVRKRLKADKAKRQAIKDKGKAVIGEISKQTDKTISAIRNGAAKVARPLEKKLARRTKVRPERQKNQCPIYKSAKSSGYDDGTEPSQYEIQQRVSRGY